MTFHLRWVALVVSVLLAASAASAQVDFRNSDRGRPLMVEDAYPIERYGFDFSVPIRWQFGAGRPGGAELGPELEYGLVPNLAVGLGATVTAGAMEPGVRRSRVGAEIFALYNVRRETRDWPALAVRVDGMTPLGAGEAAVAISVLATGSFGRQRFHLNGSWAATGPDDAPRWWIGLGIDRTLIRSSTLLQAEIVMRQARSLDPSTVDVGVGIRRQLTHSVVLNGGARRAIVNGDGEGSLIVGMSYAFGWAALMPGRTR